MRRFAIHRSDAAEAEIVKKLTEMGATVQTGHHDILVGFAGLTFWFEVKSPSTKAQTAMKPRGPGMRKTAEQQSKLRDGWHGQLDVVTCFEEARAVIRERLTTLDESIRIMASRGTAA